MAGKCRTTETPAADGDPCPRRHEYRFCLCMHCATELCKGCDRRAAQLRRVERNQLLPLLLREGRPVSFKPCSYLSDNLFTHCVSGITAALVISGIALVPLPVDPTTESRHF